MHFNSVEQILTQLEQQPGWEKFREYRQLLKYWEQIVKPNVAQQTRPLYIERQILYVATSSAARAQELSFQRYTLLKRLNKQLTFNLKDIRFSSSQWHHKNYEQKIEPNLFTIRGQQKSKFPNLSLFTNQAGESLKSEVNGTSPQDQAKNAAQRWLKTIEGRTSLGLICPECHSLTSKKELARWNSCYHCIAQKWSEEYRPPTFPETK